MVTHGDGAFSSSYRESRQVGGTMRVLIGALIIVVGAFVMAAINEFVDSLPLAVALEILLLAVAVGIRMAAVAVDLPDATKKPRRSERRLVLPASVALDARPR